MKAPLCRVAEIPADGTLTVDFFGREALVMQIDGQPRAVVNACLHLGGPLERCGERLVCVWHGAAFACADGRRLTGPAHPQARLMVIPTRIEDGTLFYVYGE